MIIGEWTQPCPGVQTDRVGGCGLVVAQYSREIVRVLPEAEGGRKGGGKEGGRKGVSEGRRAGGREGGRE